MLRAAIVGAGTMGRVHGGCYLKVVGVQVSAVCDRDRNKAEALAGRLGAKAYTDYEEMLDKEAVDFADICLPTIMHRECALKAFERGRHVFCEKPIALSISDAEDMVEAALQKNLKFMVGHVVRYFPAYTRAVETVKSGKIGTPKLIRTVRAGTFPAWSWQNWYGNRSLSGGTLLDLVIHDFDWIRSSFSDVERVYAKNLLGRNCGNSGSGSSDACSFDHCLAVLRLKNGSVAHVQGSWAYPAGSAFYTTFEIIGTKGQIEFDSRSSVPLKKYLSKDGAANIITESPVFDREEPYTRELQAFADCIMYDRQPDVPGAEAVKALEISLAALESARTGEAVVLGGAV